MSPFDTYVQRLHAREAQSSHFDKLHGRIGNARVGLATAAAVAAWLWFGRHAISAIWSSALIVVFVGLVLYHQNVQRLRLRAQRAVVFYRDGIDRLQDRWVGRGQTGDLLDVPHHIYAADLDLFGKGSIFELLSIARTQMGEKTLAQWLMSPASMEEIRERHACIADLRNRLDLRETLVLLGEEAGVRPRSEALTSWTAAPAMLSRQWIRWVPPSLAGVAVATAILWAAGGTKLPFMAVLVIEGAIAYLLRRRIQTVIAGVENAFEDLRLLSAMLNRIEREHFDAAPMQARVAELSSHTMTASRTFARLATIVNMVESRRNPFLLPFKLPLMYSLQVALAAERWRSAHGSVVSPWLKVLGEIEALVSIAGYSYEHPDDPFPEFLDGPATFQATELGHPLISDRTCIRNDISIGEETRVLLVSGSNMSGKSTLLRTVGINTVLAMAGAPVRAKRLRLTPLQVGASIRVNDSLQEGSSRFYAEITRLRQLFEPYAQALPLLFLLDELLQGTNSKDRRIGAEGIIRALVERGAIGLISTHDLALTDMAGLDEGVLKNVHFQDELENGTLRCDFKLREGVVSKSNGIELMRSIGLNV
jgi:hypothetical protein